MKKYFLIALLIMGIGATTCATAQDMQTPKANKKEEKMDKKQLKMETKNDNGRQRKAIKKEDKSNKKAVKMDVKDAEHK